MAPQVARLAMALQLQREQNPRRVQARLRREWHSVHHIECPVERLAGRNQLDCHGEPGSRDWDTADRSRGHVDAVHDGRPLVRQEIRASGRRFVPYSYSVKPSRGMLDPYHHSETRQQDLHRHHDVQRHTFPARGPHGISK
jgi:hypothetical protein